MVFTNSYLPSDTIGCFRLVFLTLSGKGATLVWISLIINETVINENVILKYLLIIFIFI